jgi:hypothetical protein
MSSNIKRATRERMARTGERYTVALAAVRASRVAPAPCATCDDTGGITVAPPGLGGSNSPHAVDVRCPDCNDTGGF